MLTKEYKKPKRDRTTWRGIRTLLVVLTLSGGWLVFIRRTSPRALLERSSVALSFESPEFWDEHALNDGVPILATLSDTNWLVGQLHSTPNAIQYRMDRLKLDPLRRSANARLASLLNQEGTLAGDIEPSPDGRWVIGTGLRFPLLGSPAWRIAAETNGPRVVRWSASLPAYDDGPSARSMNDEDPSNDEFPLRRSMNGSYLAWMPDSRNVAEIIAEHGFHGDFGLRATLHDVFTGRTSKLQFSGIGQPELGAQLAIRRDVLLFSSIGNLNTGWTSPVRRLLRVDKGRRTVKATTVDLYSWPMTEPGRAAGVTHLNTPPGTWLVGLAFSADGKRIAWEVVRDNSPSQLELLLARLRRHAAPAPSEQIEVWESGVDGSGMGTIGYLPSAEYGDAKYQQDQLHLAWLPGDRGLRFAFDEKIYTIKGN